MKTMEKALAVLVLLTAVAVVPSCKPPSLPRGTYNVEVVSFVLSGQDSSASGPAPGIWINTNVKVSGLSGGTVESRKPYGLGIDYTDNDRAFASAEITSVKITYRDGTIDPGVAALKLPMRIKARDYESINSVNGGRIVKTTSRIISRQIPGVIGRDEPFTLRIEGHFTKGDGGKVPFAVDQSYDIKTESGTKSAAEVLRDG